MQPAAPTGVSSAGSALSTPELRDLVIETADKELKKHGGPFQYLQAQYNTAEKRQALANKLVHMFPLRDTANLP
eukprot:15215579-Alexandrium_andersonii.AAC.1